MASTAQSAYTELAASQPRTTLPGPGVLLDAGARGEPGRPMPIVSEVPSSELIGGLREEEPPPRISQPVGRYPQDIPVAVLSAILAGSTFLPWYRAPGVASATGWSSGTWGPIILALGAGSFLLILLRRLKIPVGLPFEESLVHEGIGWLSLIGIALKSRFRPGQNLFGIGYGIYVAIGAAVLLLLIAGRMSPHAPLVVRPGWFRGRAGRIGMVVIALVLASAATFATTNAVNLSADTTTNRRLPPGTVRGLPKCAESFPVPKDVRPTFGVGEKDAPTCQAYFSDDRSLADAVAAFKESLDKAGWTYTTQQQSPAVTQFDITKPRCGQLYVVSNTQQGSSGSLAYATFGPCTPAPTAP